MCNNDTIVLQSKELKLIAQTDDLLRWPPSRMNLPFQNGHTALAIGKHTDSGALGKDYVSVRLLLDLLSR